MQTIYRKPIANRHQLDLFIHYKPVHDAVKNFSPNNESYGMRHQPVHADLDAMPSNIKQSLIDFEEAQAQGLATFTRPTDTVHDYHAIPNHDSRTHSRKQGSLPKPKGQQRFTFEADHSGSGVSRVASSDAERADQFVGKPPSTTNFSSGIRTGTEEYRRTDSERIPRHLIADLVPNPAFAAPYPYKIAISHPEPTNRSEFRSTTEDQQQQITPIAKTTVSADKAKARDIIAAIKTLKQIESENRLATDSERQVMKRFGGFGAVALSLFPDPLKGTFKDVTWEALGNELKSTLTLDEYESAKRTTFNAFYTSPIVIDAMHQALSRLGMKNPGRVLEPGCGTGNFLKQLADSSHCIGVELDSITGRMTQAIYPNQDIRIENFRDTKLADNSLDAVIGNVPFANIKYEHKGNRFALHDYFFAKSMDALKPGGVMALVTSHFTLDKQNASIREYLSEQADFVGAVRLPADAFKNEGTKVVTDIVFLRKRDASTPAQHMDPD